MDIFIGIIESGLFVVFQKIGPVVTISLQSNCPHMAQIYADIIIKNWNLTLFPITFLFW